MDQATSETLKLLQLRSELLAILRGPDADREIQRWLLLRRTLASAPVTAEPVLGPVRPT